MKKAHLSGNPQRPSTLPPCDADGFLLDSQTWSRDLAETLASLDGIGPLQPGHWAVIYYLREHFESYGALPPIAQACRAIGMDRDAVRQLFGGCHEAWRIAGLPHPGEEAVSYM